VPPGPNVLFVGALYRALNVQGVEWFLDQVWPAVVREMPQARFYVVGYDPPQSILDRHDGEHVFVVGFSEELAPWYRAAQVSISPLLVAGGLLQKVVDALNVGTPVVATSVSNHGVGATPGEHLLLADAPADFAAAILRLLEDPAERDRLARAGKQFVRQRYDLERALLCWEAACGIANAGDEPDGEGRT
jgi:glycosyltransferase involved in cell wall biosynthesis